MNSRELSRPLLTVANHAPFRGSAAVVLVRGPARQLPGPAFHAARLTSRLLLLVPAVWSYALEFDSLGSTAFPTCEYRAIESA